MKSPELRKELSELVLHKRGIRINLQLSLIESEDEICLRSADALAQRLTALRLLRHFSISDTNQKVAIRQSIKSNQLHACFSPAERHYLLHDTDQDGVHDLDGLSTNGEAFHFLLWAGGLQKSIGMPDGQIFASVAEQIIAPLPESPAALISSIKLRSKSEMLDWADLLYRLHWAVSHAHITGKPTPGRLNADAVHEWHKAVNWLIQFDDENDWDKVSTETAG